METIVDLANVGNGSIAPSLSWYDAIKEVNHSAKDYWAYHIKPSPDLAMGWNLIASSDEINSAEYIYSKTPTDIYSKITVYISWSSNHITLWICGNNPFLLHEAIAEFREFYPKAEAFGKNVPVEFFYNTANGPRSVDRDIDVPTWADIALNYPVKVRERVDWLVDFRPTHGGQLLLFQGKPGTGKTFTIRSLIKEWSPWCTSTVITDPDEFFGGAQYLMNVILREQDRYDYEDEESGEMKKSAKWNLIILEDAGEMLSKDARSRVGQGLSRLLNLTEGMIGQGLKILILISTNEELRELHEAVSRPGRCAAQIEFSLFNPTEANSWRAAHRLKEKVTGGSLADLYAELEGGLIPAELAVAGLR